jgi:LysM repeat protein
MKSWKRLLFYISVNILVSACTTFAVLFAWDQLYGPLPRNLLPKALPQALGQLSATATPTPAPAVEGTPAAQVTPTEAFVVYQVVSGDTFESIAATHNISVEELVAVNGFSQSQPLGAGEVLRIPTRPTGSVAIDSIIGAGDLDSERVLIKHHGGGQLSLVGWRLEDDRGNAFIFPRSPELILYPGGAVNIYTKVGVNTVVDLFWGLDAPVWASGSTVILRDAEGNIHAKYVVP